jgi:hypothetical protein
MKTKKTSRPSWLILLVLLQFLLGIGAFVGGALLVWAPDGSALGVPLSILKPSPFVDFFIPGLFLFTFVGVYPMLVAWSLWRRPKWRWPYIVNPLKRMHWSWAGSLAAGVIVVIWIVVQILMIRDVGFLHYLYLGWGIVLMILTLLPSVRRDLSLP